MPEFECFIPIASNALFFRPFDAPEALVRLTGMPRPQPAVSLAALPDVWWWPRLKQQVDACQLLQSRWQLSGLHASPIEGLMATRHDWQLVFDVCQSLASVWHQPELPLQEVLPASVINTLGSGQLINLCHTRPALSPVDPGRLATVADLIIPPYLSHICMIKWFECSLCSPETIQVATEHGRELSRWLTAELRSSRIGMEQELLLTHTHQGLLQSHARTCLVRAAQATDPPPRITNFHLRAQQQVVDRDGQPTSRTASFFALANTDLPLTIRTRTTDHGDLFLYCYFHGSPGDLAESSTDQQQAVFFLPIPSKPSLRLLLQGSVHGVDSSSILRHLRLFDGRAVSLCPPVAPTIIFHEFTCELYLDTSAAQNAHLGIPLYLGMSLRLRLHDIGA